MASQVPPSKAAIPPEKRQKAGIELETPQDYKETYRVSSRDPHLES
jgi:hypothetical protein